MYLIGILDGPRRNRNQFVNKFPTDNIGLFMLNHFIVCVTDSVKRPFSNDFIVVMF